MKTIIVIIYNTSRYRKKNEAKEELFSCNCRSMVIIYFAGPVVWFVP